MEPETLMRLTYDDVIKFLEKRLGMEKMSSVAQQLNNIFPDWSNAWSALRKWLLTEHPLTNMQKSIHSFAQLFPNYKTFANDLDQSLSIDEDFWNKVFIRLCAAQQLLK